MDKYLFRKKYVKIQPKRTEISPDSFPTFAESTVTLAKKFLACLQLESDLTLAFSIVAPRTDKLASSKHASFSY